MQMVATTESINILKLSVAVDRALEQHEQACVVGHTIGSSF